MRNLRGNLSTEEPISSCRQDTIPATAQSLPDWIDDHCRAFSFFGGVTDTLVPDNLKTGVTHPHRYESELNPTYTDMATHYGVAVIPTFECLAIVIATAPYVSI